MGEGDKRKTEGAGHAVGEADKGEAEEAGNG